MKMTLIDVLTLAKQGYKKADIDALMEVEIEEPVEKPKEEPKEEPVEEPTEEQTESDEVSDLKKQIEELTKKLENAQKANINKDMSDKKSTSNDEVLQSLVDSFM